MGDSEVESVSWEGFEVVDELTGDEKSQASDSSAESNNKSRRRRRSSEREFRNRNRFSRVPSYRNNNRGFINRNFGYRYNRRGGRISRGFRGGAAFNRYGEGNISWQEKRRKQDERCREKNTSKQDTFTGRYGKSHSGRGNLEEKEISAKCKTRLEKGGRSSVEKENTSKPNKEIAEKSDSRQNSPPRRVRKDDFEESNFKFKRTLGIHRSQGTYLYRQMHKLIEHQFEDFTSPPLRKTAAIKKVSCSSNWKNFKRVIILSDGRIEFDKDIIEIKSQCEIKVFNKPQLILDELVDFTKEKVDLSIPVETLMLCSVGTYDLVSLKDVEACQNVSEHKPFKQVSMKNPSDNDILEKIIKKSKEQKKKLLKLLGSGSEVYFTTVNFVSLVKFHEKQLKLHKETDHDLTLQFDISSLKEMEDKLERVIESYNEYNLKNNLPTLSLDIKNYMKMPDKNDKSYSSSCEVGLEMNSDVSLDISHAFIKDIKRFLAWRSRFSKVIFVGDLRLEYMRKAWPADVRYNCKIITDPDLTLGNLSNASDPVMKEICSSRDSLIVISLGIKDLCKLVPNPECKDHKKLEVFVPDFSSPCKTANIDKNINIDRNVNKMIEVSVNMCKILKVIERLTYNCTVFFTTMYDFDLLSHQEYVMDLHQKEVDHTIVTPTIEMKDDKLKDVLNVIQFYNMLCLSISGQNFFSLRKVLSWIPDKIVDDKGTERIPLSLLYDGVHPSPSVAAEMARRYKIFADCALKIKSENFRSIRPDGFLSFITKCSARILTRKIEESKDMHNVKNFEECKSKDTRGGDDQTVDGRRRTSVSGDLPGSSHSKERRHSEQGSSGTTFPESQYSSHLLDHSFSDVSDLESCDSRNFESYSGRDRQGKETQHSESAGGHKRSDFKSRDYKEAQPFNKGHRQLSPVLHEKNFPRSFSISGRSKSRSLSPLQNTRSYMRSVSFPTAISRSRVYNVTSCSKNPRLSSRRSYSRSPSPGKKFYSSASRSRSPPRQKSPETLALMSLRDVHNKECKVYRKNPKAHPDHEKEFRIYRDKKMQCIIGLGGDPNSYDVTKDWEAFWPNRLEQLLELSWISKRDKCLKVLKQSKLSRNRSPLLGLQQRTEFSRKLNRSRSRSSSRESERQLKNFSRKLKRNRSASRSYSPESEILSCKKNSFITKQRRNRSRSRSVSWESERRSASRERERLLQKEREYYIRKQDRKRSRSRSSSVESKAQSEDWNEFIAEQEEKRSRSRSSSRKSERFSQKQRDYVTMSKRKRSRSSSEESEGQSDDKGEFNVKENRVISKLGSSKEREIILKRRDTSSSGKRSDNDHSCEGDRSITFGKDKTESLPGLSCFLEKHLRDNSGRNQDSVKVNLDVKENELSRLKTILNDEQIHNLLKLSKEIPLDVVGKSSLSSAVNKEFIVGSQSMKRGSGHEMAGDRIILKMENSVKGSELIFPPKIDAASLEHQISQVHPLQECKSSLLAEVLEKIEARSRTIKSDIETSKASSSSRSGLPSANEEESADEVTSTTPSFGTGMQEDIMEVLEILVRLGDRLNVLKMPLKVLYDKALLYKSVGTEASKLLNDKDAKTLLHLISSKLSKLMEEENMTIVQRVIIQEANERLCNILKTLDPDLEISLIAEKCLGKNEADTIAYIQSQFLENGLYSGSHERLKAVYAAVQSEKSKLLNQILKQSNTSLNSPTNSIMNTFHIQSKEMSAKHEMSSYSPFQHSWFSEDSQGSRSVGNSSSLLGDNIKKETAAYSKLPSEYKLEFPPKLQLEDILPKRQVKNSCVQKKCEDFTSQWECEDSPPQGTSKKYLSEDNIDKQFRKTHTSPRLEFEGLRKQLRDSHFETGCDKFSSQRVNKGIPSRVYLDFSAERQRDSGRSKTDFGFSSLQEGDEFSTKIELDFPSKRVLEDSPKREFGKFSSKALLEDILCGRVHEGSSSKQEEKGFLSDMQFEESHSRSFRDIPDPPNISRLQNLRFSHEDSSASLSRGASKSENRQDVTSSQVCSEKISGSLNGSPLTRNFSPLLPPFNRIPDIDTESSSKLFLLISTRRDLRIQRKTKKVPKPFQVLCRKIQLGR
ncbi:uncharacterized protein LOC135201549 [Macrobrachium nipponense]|uniref:uncharacterized protein LOC135201549 n=1 Tax=Macrobrachium nipponense TaxID=159736 RepID=UPI0030C80AF4